MPDAPAVPRILGKEILPGPQSLTIGGRESILPRQDPVLLHLAQKADEREWEGIYTRNTDVSQAVGQRIEGVLHEGSVVEAGSKSPTAMQLKDWAVDFLKAIPAWPVVQRDALMAIFYGWRPLERKWAPMDHGGRSYLGVVEIVARDPWEYHLTHDGDLVEERRGELRVYRRNSLAALRHMVCTANTTKSRYGLSDLRKVWIKEFLVRRLEQMGADAVQRAAGLLTVKSVGNLTSQQMADLDGELRRVIEAVRKHGVLLDYGGWTVGLADQSQQLKGLAEFHQFVAEQIYRALAGQNLSGKVEGGSFAAAQSHALTLEQWQMADARQLQEWVNDQLIGPAIRLNFGAVSELDFPRWRPKILKRVDPNRAKVFAGLGGYLDGGQLAESWGLPAVDPRNVDPEAILVGGRPVPVVAGSVEEEESGSAPVGGRQPGGRSLSRALPDLDDEVSRYRQRVTDLFLAANPDPKA